ncbi:type I-D CRISPR-associated protein Cas7/Csc2 [Methanosarcinales archaeon]|nr:MAG: type I-D CRISPR-associated protein Cas7/Csc2 [Methanosarcinales archaeon]
MNESMDFGELEKFFVDDIGLYRTANTIQLLLLRQTHDYTIFRTEETRELNVVTLPSSSTDPSPMIRVAMLASKQKAVESRHFLTLVRTAAGEENLDEEQKKCALKDALCQKCPRCVLFGAVSTERGRGRERWNIKHRVEYSTAYSLEPYDEISELMTFNAVYTVSQSTGQALGYTENISPLANFPTVITLNSVTKEEFVAFLKCVLSCKSYGAETRVKGDVVNHLLGVVGGYEEIITPLEFCLEATNEGFLENPVDRTFEIMKKFSEYAMFQDNVVIMRGDEITEKIKEIPLDRTLALSMYEKAKRFSDKLVEYDKRSQR